VTTASSGWAACLLGGGSADLLARVPLLPERWPSSFWTKGFSHRLGLLSSARSWACGSVRHRGGARAYSRRPRVGRKAADVSYGPPCPTHGSGDRPDRPLNRPAGYEPPALGCTHLGALAADRDGAGSESLSARPDDAREAQALGRDRLPGWPVTLRMREVLCRTTVGRDDTHPFIYSAAAEDLVQVDDRATVGRP
jgi:hypothetical protein